MCTHVHLHLMSEKKHAQLPPGGQYRAGGRLSTRPARLPHPWGTTSCHKAAPLTYEKASPSLGTFT